MRTTILSCIELSLDSAISAGARLAQSGTVRFRAVAEASHKDWIYPELDASCGVAQTREAKAV